MRPRTARRIFWVVVVAVFVAAVLASLAAGQEKASGPPASVQAGLQVQPGPASGPPAGPGRPELQQPASPQAATTESKPAPEAFLRGYDQLVALVEVIEETEAGLKLLRSKVGELRGQLNGQIPAGRRFDAASRSFIPLPAAPAAAKQ